MAIKTAHLDHRHLKFYGKVLGARPDSLDLDDDFFVDRMSLKTKRVWRRKIGKDNQTPETSAPKATSCARGNGGREWTHLP